MFVISILVAISVSIQPIIAEIFWGDEYFLRHSDDCLFKIDGADVKTVGNHNLTANSSFNCGDLCYKDQYCTHFNWFPKNQSKCELKFTNSSWQSRSYAQNFEKRALDHSGTHCGFLNIKWNVEKATERGQTEWAFNCEFLGDYIDRIRGGSDICGSECEMNTNCSHFTWIDKKGICYLKNGRISKGDEVYRPKSICGTVRRIDQCSCDCD